MNILVIAKQNMPVDYHRLIVPFRNLHNVDNIIVDFLDIVSPSITVLDEPIESFLKSYDWVVFSRMIHPFLELVDDTVKMIRKAGCRIIVDLDDYWILEKNHVIYESYTKNNFQKIIEKSIEHADVVTTSTKFLSSLVKLKFPLKETYVLPVCIDTKEPQFNFQPTESDVLRFGYVGSITHQHDINLLSYSMDKLWKDNRLKFKIFLCGYSVYDGQREGQPYPNMEKVLTNNYSRLTEPLSLEESYKFPKDYPYQRVPYQYDVNKYAYMYSNFDVSIAPLENTLFNRCKSELKMVEAGVLKKAIIVSNIHPFTIFANKKNSILVNDNKRGWHDAMSKLIKNPNLKNDLTEQLSLDVKELYNLEDVNHTRKQILIK
jgi:glycosyltransferase involved in cell wall biosynthesis